jgi:hypothetical protein
MNPTIKRQSIKKQSVQSSIFLLALFISSTVHALGFSMGNEFQAKLLVGNLTMVCPGTAINPAQQTTVFNCRSSVLSPVDADYFVGPQVNGDSVTLLVTRVDGSTRSKTVGYDGKAGKSVARLNLWVSSLTQRPLLADGLSTIEYFITMGKDIVAKGSYEAQVIRDVPITCGSKTTYAYSADDCQNQVTACGRYFSENNYCQ